MPQYLERRRRRWYAKLTVPEDVRDVIGKLRFVESLKTESRSVAEQRALLVIHKWKSEIDRARAAKAGQLDTLEEEAREWRDALRSAKDEDQRGELLEHLRDRSERVMAAKGGTASAKSVEDLPGYADGVRFYQIATGQRVPLTEHLEEYLNATTNLQTDKTKAMARSDVGRLAKEFETVADVNRKEVQRWTTTLMAADGENLAPKTAGRIVSACRGYWRYLRTIEVIPEEAPDPFGNLELSRSANGRAKRKSPADQRRHFEPADVVKLHRAAQERGDDTLADLILLAMYTGARIEELCSLTLDRAHEDRLEIVDAKTAAGWRVVPIHSKIRQTVARLVDGRTDGYLLSDLPLDKYGHRSTAIGKRFGRLKAAQGFDKRYVFHSIRKTVATLFERANVPHNLAAEIMGHEKAGVMTYTLYSGGFASEDRSAAVEKMEYPTVRA